MELIDINFNHWLHTIISLFPTLLIIFATVKIASSGLRLIEKVVSILLMVGIFGFIVTQLF